MLLAGLFVRSPKFKFNSSNNLKKQAAAFSVSEQSAWLIFQNTSSNRWLGSAGEHVSLPSRYDSWEPLSWLINYGKFSLTYRGATVWNSLTTDLKELKSYNKFKTSLKVHIQNDLHFVG